MKPKERTWHTRSDLSSAQLAWFGWIFQILVLQWVEMQIKQMNSIIFVTQVNKEQ